MGDNEVKLKITSDASQAVAGMDRVRGSMKGMEAESATMIGKIKAHWLGYSAALAGVGITFGAVKDAMIQGAKAMQSETAFRNTAEAMGVNADMMIADLKRVTNATIDDSDLMQKAMKGMTAGMSSDQIVKIGEISRTAARRMGVDVGEAYNSIVDAVEIMKTKSLKAWGLITAEQVKLVDEAKAAGVAVDIFRIMTLNAAIQTEKMGGALENANERFQQSAAIVKDVKEKIGIGLVITLADTIQTLRTFAGSWKILWQDIRNATKGSTSSVNEGLLSLTGSMVSGAGKANKEDPAKALSDEEKRIKAATAAAKSQGRMSAAGDAHDAWATKMRGLGTELATLYQDDVTKAIIDIEAKTAEMYLEASRLAAKHGIILDTSLIGKWKSASIENARYQDELKQTEKILGAMAEVAEKEAAATTKKADTTANRAIDEAKDVADLQSKYTDLAVTMGTMTEREGIETRYALALKIIDAEWERLSVLSQIAYTEEEIARIGNDAFELTRKRTQLEQGRLYSLAASDAKKGAGDMGEEIANALRNSLEDLFFDPMKFSWENLWNSLRRIAAKSMADMVMDWFKAQMKMSSGGGKGLFGMFSGLLGYGGTGADPGYSMQPGVEFHSGGPVRRMHRGGLMSDEVPAILQTGEYVMSRKQVAAMKSGGGSGATVNNVTINATDAQSFTNMLRSNPNAIADAFMSAGRSNHPARRRR